MGRRMIPWSRLSKKGDVMGRIISTQTAAGSILLFLLAGSEEVFNF